MARKDIREWRVIQASARDLEDRLNQLAAEGYALHSVHRVGQLSDFVIVGRRQELPAGRV